VKGGCRWLARRRLEPPHRTLSDAVSATSIAAIYSITSTRQSTGSCRRPRGWCKTDRFCTPGIHRWKPIWSAS